MDYIMFSLIIIILIIMVLLILIIWIKIFLLIIIIKIDSTKDKLHLLKSHCSLVKKKNILFTSFN